VESSKEFLPEVGVIVTAYNNADTLRECVSSLVAQLYPKKQIIIVCDTSSSDDTERVAENLASLNENCTLIKCNAVGRSRARNLGWKKSNVPITMFADADDIYEPHYLLKAVEAISTDPKLGGVCLGGKALNDGNGILYRFYDSYGATDLHLRVDSSEPDWAWVYKRECLEEVGGFDEELSQAEDKDLCNRVKSAGHKIAYVPGVNWYRRKPRTVLKFIKKEYQAGKRGVVYELRRGKYFSLLYNLIPLAYVLLTGYLILLSSLGLALLLMLVGVAFFSTKVLQNRRISGALPSIVPVLAIAMLAKIASSAGSLYGLLVLLLRRMGVVDIDLGRF
jgi:cellulose synthase/poly-beta-1,6-N-acetylglucosamine synthase-like glycosyltransferase